MDSPLKGAARLGLILVGAAIPIAISLGAAAPVAGAQAPAVCDEYAIGFCGGSSGGGSGHIAGTSNGGASQGVPGGGGGATASAGGNAGANDGAEAATLPFTGYPVTPLVVLLLILLAAGILVRSYVAVRHRLRARHATSGRPRL